MKLAEALAARADAQARLQELRARIAANARHQEGEAPAEDPNALVAEAERLTGEIAMLVKRINATNASSVVEGVGTVTDAIAERDALGLRHRVLSEAASQATGSGREFRLTHSELRMVTTLDVTELRRLADEVARQRRELDLKIQATDWATELQEN
jgi:hypothetical protein